MVDDIFFVLGYDLKGSVVAQVIPLLLCFFFLPMFKSNYIPLLS